MKCISILSAMLLCTQICAAQTTSGTDTQTINMDTITVSALAGPPRYQATAPRIWDIKHTRIALSFNWKEKTADVREWIKARPYFYASDTFTLDAKGMEIDTVLVVTKEGKIRPDYIYTGDQLKLHFRKTYKASDSIELYFRYKAMPYATSTGGSKAITDDRGLYFINTDYSLPNKPAQIWTQGETESNSRWMITVDKPNVRFTTQVELTVPDSFVTLSNGAKTKTFKNNNGTRTDIWNMNLPIQAYVVMFAIGKYDIVKDKWKNKEVNYYVEPAYEPYARLIFNHTTEMMDYFSLRTGVPYPWNKYDQVIVRDYVSGAMENTTASLFGEFVNQDAREIADNNYEDVVAHELFHMWFGDYVTAESWSNVTVNESFANYGEQLWRTHKYGKASGDELAYNDLHGQAGYIAASQGEDPALVRFYYDSREELFDRISYNKGGAILRYLNDLIGDAAFDKAMKLYLTKNALNSAEAHHWRLAVEEVTGLDWNWFFNQWYYRGGHPVLKIVYNYNDTTQQLTMAVSQVQEDSTFLYDLPLKAAVINGNNKMVTDWHIYKRRDTFIYPYQNGQRPVIVPDYNHVLPGEIRDGKKAAQWVVQFKQTNDYISKRFAVAAAGKLMSDTSSQATIDAALNDKIPAIRRFALGQLSNTSSDKYKKKWTAKITDMATGDPDNKVRAAAFDVLGEWKVAAAKPIMLGALKDNSYAVAGNALEALSKLDADTAYTLAKRILSTSPRGGLENAVWTIIGKKGADNDADLYEMNVIRIYGQKRIYFAFGFNSYMKNVKSDASFRKAADAYALFVTTESMKAYRKLLAGFMFNVATDQKNGMKSDKPDEVETARKRLEIMKAALEKVVAAEKDEEMKKSFDKSMAEISK